MRKDQFIENVEGLLGSGVDALCLKRYFEEDCEIGHMTYSEAWIFISGFDKSLEALKGLVTTIKEMELIGETSPTCATIDGMSVWHKPRGKRNNFYRPTENEVIDKERK